MTPAEAALTGARAACGVVLASRHSLLDRLQGGRMVAQAPVETWLRGGVPQQPAKTDTNTVYRIAAVVDTLHGISMLALAALPGNRRHAAVSAGLALSFAAGDLLVCRTAQDSAAGSGAGAHQALLMEV
jgi:hypothetical protein